MGGSTAADVIALLDLPMCDGVAIAMMIAAEGSRKSYAEEQAYKKK